MVNIAYKYLNYLKIPYMEISMFRFLRSWSHTTAFKFSIFTLVAIVGTICLTIALLWMEKNALLDERKIGAKQTVEVANGVLNYFYEQEKSGVLTKEQAQEKALSIIAEMRYSGQEYFFLTNLKGYIVMHPIQPSLNGKDMIDLKDAGGSYLVRNMIKATQADATRGGFVIYLWPKPGSDKPVEKVSYVQEFQPWGWIVVSGVYLDTVTTTVLGQAWKFIFAGLILAAILLVLGVYLSRRLVRQLGAEPSEAIKIANEMAKGNLSVPINLRPNDNNSLLFAMKTMRDGIAGAVHNVREGTTFIAQSVSQIVAGNMDLSSRTEQQAASLQETAASMEEITSTVSHNANNAQQANDLAADARKVATEGGNGIQQVIKTMDEVNASTQQMSDIISVIDSIAFQTNILALNAAVEAARAGEQGRGFAVVASEVRALAQRSSNSANEIRDLIDNTVQKIKESSELVNTSGSTMSEIVNRVQKVADIMEEITLASKEQATGIGQVNLAISQMDQVTQQNATLVVQAGEAAKSLNDQMNGLNNAVRVFRLENSNAN